MTDEEYLYNLNLVEGYRDALGTTTSDIYGMTDVGIKRIVQNITANEDGKPTELALATQAFLSPKLQKVINNKTKKVKNKYKSLPKVDDIAPLGQKAWAELALATRMLNKEQIARHNGSWLSEDEQDRLCIVGHQRPLVLTSKEMDEAYASRNSEIVRHQAMTDLRGVSDSARLGTQKRLAIAVGTDWKETTIEEKVNHFNGVDRLTLPLLINEAYDKDAAKTKERLEQTSMAQSADSKIYANSDTNTNKTQYKPLPNEEAFYGALGMQVEQPQEAQQAEEQSLPLGRRLLNAVRSHFPRPISPSNQVAQQPENMLNNTNGAKQ